MIEEKKIKADELSALEVENERLRRELAKRPIVKRTISTSTIEAPPTISSRPNIMISTTHPQPRPIGNRMLQTHGLALPAPDAAGILARVKRDRAADVQKKEKR